MCGRDINRGRPPKDPTSTTSRAMLGRDTTAMAMTQPPGDARASAPYLDAGATHLHLVLLHERHEVRPDLPLEVLLLVAFFAELTPLLPRPPNERGRRSRGVTQSGRQEGRRGVGSNELCSHLHCPRQTVAPSPTHGAITPASARSTSISTRHHPSATPSMYHAVGGQSRRSRQALTACTRHKSGRLLDRYGRPGPFTAVNPRQMPEDPAPAFPERRGSSAWSLEARHRA